MRVGGRPARQVGRPPQRREFLRLGALGAVGLSLPTLLRAGTLRASSADRSFGRAKRCILVFLNGGPSQLDTWDMKPNAPAEVRGELKPISTSVPGIQASELLPLIPSGMHVFGSKPWFCRKKTIRFLAAVPLVVDATRRSGATERSSAAPAPVAIP